VNAPRQQYLNPKLNLKGIDSIMQSITRRSILKGGLAFSATAATSAMSVNSLWAEPLVRVPGIQLYTVDKELKADVEGTLKKVHAIGYLEVETAGFGGYSAKHFRTALENAGLKCASSHFFSLGSGDPAPMFEDANTLGVHYTVSSGIGRFTSKPAGTSMTADDYKGMAEYCNQLGEKAKQAGLQFAYHNHNFEFQDLGGGKVGYDVFIENTDPNSREA
jgi:sugar phosphate isomerase/epimerase